MDELFITNHNSVESKIAQARQPLLDTEVPNFTDSTKRDPAIPRIQAFDPSQQRQSLFLQLDAQHEKVYTKPAVPSGRTPPITYSRTLYRKSDYSAYNKQLPQMPTIWPTDRVVSQSGLFLTPPQSPAARVSPPIPTPVSVIESISDPESTTSSMQRNFSRKFTKRKIKQSPGHLPMLQRAKTFQSESADVQSASMLSTPVSAVPSLSEADRTSFNMLADSLKRSLSPPSPLKERSKSHEY